MDVSRGVPAPLGAMWDGEGVNFAVFSENAEEVELCFFDTEEPGRQIEALRLRDVDAHVWHGYVPGVGPGLLYGYRVRGPYEPESGDRFNPAKVLLDPYAQAVATRVDWDEPVFGYRIGHPREDLAHDDRDSAAGAPKGVVIDPTFDWGDDGHPDTPWSHTIIYETHVKGATMRHPEVPEDLRGTYAGLASEPFIQHLTSLGVTAVELLPVHHILDDHYLVEKGLRNYWGYNTLNYFAPDARYSSGGDRGGQVAEFKNMVKALHAAGLEVILDVVYNHTAEGNHLGPTLSFRGLDNRSYYRLVEDDPRYYMDYSGTGNSLNMLHPEALRLIMDSLRYWVEEMHVDGFRFDLAAALARELHDVDRLSAFFDIIHQDPLLSGVKLIAEPWDLGPGGYQVGNFPVLWTEWNGRYRDAVRSYWRGDRHGMAELGYRLTGSNDLYGGDGRRPTASINFVTAHDGFTLEDLVSYDRKHNEANGEDNEDGTDHNLSANYGVEGPTDDPDINELRQRQKRNLLTTLLCSQGVPMILGGDEIGRSQGGNNNAYCQDNEISWFDWDLDERARDFLEFTRRVIRLRKKHPALRRKRFFQGVEVRGSDVPDITWLTPEGREMTDEEWESEWSLALAFRLSGEALGEVDSEGELIMDNDFLFLLNTEPRTTTFRMPDDDNGEWRMVVDTASATGEGEDRTYQPGELLEVRDRAVVVLIR